MMLETRLREVVCELKDRELQALYGTKGATGSLAKRCLAARYPTGCHRIHWYAYADIFNIAAA